MSFTILLFLLYFWLNKNSLDEHKNLSIHPSIYIDYVSQHNYSTQHN